ncbi:MAG: magnetochrome domain-containing protein [Deltaproteobacteria bacterium]|nr:magnetochrome domain-containing protein [Deltaproteobacteria bacterium]
MKKTEYNFCMKEFKPAVIGVSALVVVLVAWAVWHCVQRPNRPMHLSLAAATAAVPSGPPIAVKAKMTHPYWGNCNKCHVTIDAGTPVSKVMTGPPIAVKAKMTHAYWGNCLMCHKVIGGFQAQPQPQAKAAALNQFNALSLGLKTESVTAASMRQLGLANEDGALILEVAPNSLAAQGGLQAGDEIVRVGKTRVESKPALDGAIKGADPGSQVKVTLYRGKKKMSAFIMLPQDTAQNVTAAAVNMPMTPNQIETQTEQLGVPKTQQSVPNALQGQRRPAATPNIPMTQNQIETQAEQLGVPKTQQSVQNAQQRPVRPVANINYGKVAVASAGPGLGYQVYPQFGASPYFVIIDSAQNTYRTVANPGAVTAGGRGVQTGQYLVDLGVSNVVAGSFSSNALQGLRTLRVTSYAGVTGTVQDALAAFTTRRLVPVSANPANIQAASPQALASPGVTRQPNQVIF